MKNFLLYTWGAFLAVLVGAATLLSVGVVADYIDVRTVYLLKTIVPEELGGTPFGDLRSLSRDNTVQVWIIFFGVVAWTFERWRQRQAEMKK